MTKQSSNLGNPTAIAAGASIFKSAGPIAQTLIIGAPLALIGWGIYSVTKSVNKVQDTISDGVNTAAETIGLKETEKIAALRKSKAFDRNFWLLKYNQYKDDKRWCAKFFNVKATDVNALKKATDFAAKQAVVIRNAVDGYNNFNQVLAAIKSARSKADVSMITRAFAAPSITGLDLFEELDDQLYNSQMADLYDYIEKLPDAFKAPR